MDSRWNLTGWALVITSAHTLMPQVRIRKVKGLIQAGTNIAVQYLESTLFHTTDVCTTCQALFYTLGL
jgi:hypothetical protein